jgi:hypothetical protein
VTEWNMVIGMTETQYFFALGMLIGSFIGFIFGGVVGYGIAHPNNQTEDAPALKRE